MASHQATTSHQIDALVIGGGIAGLWILSALRRAGRSAVLAEAADLGNGQSTCAQGIIHGGLKYALGGEVGQDARGVSEMPGIWTSEIQSADDPLLAGATILSPSAWLWRTDSLKSRIGMLGARMALKTPADAVPKERRPRLLMDTAGSVLEVMEPILEVRSVLKALADRNAGFVVKVDGPEGVEMTSRGGRIDQAILKNAGHEIRLAPEHVILAAGSGNESLRTRLGLDPTRMQRRPLHMAMVRGPLPEFHGHCVDGNRTRVTITSTARNAEGHATWQLGGDLAEKGVEQSPEELICTAARELRSILPALDQTGLQWSTYRVDRAEMAHGGRRFQDAAIIEDGDGHTLSCWPTKLALAPRLADLVINRVASIHPATGLGNALQDLPAPETAPYPWETAATWIERSDIPA